MGHIGELTLTVADEHVIDFADAGMPAVFSTPKLIGLAKNCFIVVILVMHHVIWS